MNLKPDLNKIHHVSELQLFCYMCYNVALTLALSMALSLAGILKPDWITIMVFLVISFIFAICTTYFKKPEVLIEHER